ncbi:MAG: phenylacetate--CoA ligase, partial [Deltaproteobacteria bacterium]|nr:phenylacetate--CoA ligase [Deltaproteobacteria bacterium]
MTDRTTGFLNRDLETKSWEEQQGELERRLRDVVSHAFANAPAVNARFGAQGIEPGDIRTLADLPKIPVTPKAALVDLQRENPPFGGLLAAPLDQVRRVFRSPGPIYDPQGLDEGWGWEEALFAAGFRKGDVSINTFGYHMTPAGMMFDQALQDLGCPVV